VATRVPKGSRTTGPEAPARSPDSDAGRGRSKSRAQCISGMLATPSDDAIGLLVSRARHLRRGPVPPTRRHGAAGVLVVATAAEVGRAERDRAAHTNPTPAMAKAVFRRHRRGARPAGRPSPRRTRGAQPSLWMTAARGGSACCRQACATGSAHRSSRPPPAPPRAARRSNSAQLIRQTRDRHEPCERAPGDRSRRALNLRATRVAPRARRPRVTDWRRSIWASCRQVVVPQVTHEACARAGRRPASPTWARSPIIAGANNRACPGRAAQRPR
jgi:hypothetical protein